MPDDTVAVEVAEQAIDRGEGFSDAFNDKPEEKKVVVAKAEPEVAKVEKPEAKAKVVPSAEDKLAARAAAKTPAPETVPVVEVKALEHAKVEAVAKKPLIDLSDLADLNPEQLGGMKVKVVGDDGVESEQTLSELGKTFPELIGTAQQIARHMTRAMGERVNAALESILDGVVTKDEITALRADLGQAQFWEGVTAGVRTQDGYVPGHSDARKIVASKEFQTWSEKQSKVVQALIDSDDPEDGIAVLDAYKESLAKTSKTKATDKASEDKRKRDALHGDTLRPKIVEAEGKASDEDASFSAGFNA